MPSLRRSDVAWFASAAWLKVGWVVFSTLLLMGLCATSAPAQAPEAGVAAQPEASDAPRQTDPPERADGRGGANAGGQASAEGEASANGQGGANGQAETPDRGDDNLGTLYAHGTQNYFWIVYHSRPRPNQDLTLVFGREHGSDEWSALSQIIGRPMSLTVWRGELVIKFSSSNWRIAYRGGSRSGPTLPEGRPLVTLAGVDPALYAVAGPSPRGGESADRNMVLLSLTGSRWNVVGELPADVDAEDPLIALGPVGGRLVMAARSTDGGIAVYRLQLSPGAAATGDQQATPAQPATAQPATGPASPAGQADVAAQPGDAASPDGSAAGGEGAADAARESQSSPVIWERLGRIMPTQTIEELEVLDMDGRVGVWASPGRENGGHVYLGPQFDEAGRIDLGPAPGEVALAMGRLRLLYDDERKLTERTWSLAGREFEERTQIMLPAQAVEDQLVHTIGLAAVVLLAVSIIAAMRQTNSENTGERKAKETLPLAPVGRRLAAGLIDHVSMVAVLFSYVAYKNRDMPTAEVVLDLELLLVGAAAALTVIIHTTVLEAMTGRSVGKIVMGLRVASTDGTAPTFNAILIRNLLRVIDLWFYFTLALILFTPRKQRIGDAAAGTVVIDDRAKPEPTDDA